MAKVLNIYKFNKVSLKVSKELVAIKIILKISIIYIGLDLSTTGWVKSQEQSMFLIQPYILVLFIPSSVV